MDTGKGTSRMGSRDHWYRHPSLVRGHIHFKYLRYLTLYQQIIHKKDDPFTSLCDGGEFVLFLSDWFNKTGKELMQDLLHQRLTATSNWADLPFNSAIINGKGGTPHRILPFNEGSDGDGGLNNVPTPTPDFPRYELFNVVKGKTYRMRVINAGTSFGFVLRIESHRFKVIACDGGLVTNIDAVNTRRTTQGDEIGGSAEVDSVFIQVGERVDIMFTATQQIGNYWITAFTRENEENIETMPQQKHGVKAILRYQGAPDVDAPPLPVSHPQGVEFDISTVMAHPSESSFIEQDTIILRPSDDMTRLSIRLGGTTDPFQWNIDGLQFIMPKNVSAPLLYSVPGRDVDTFPPSTWPQGVFTSRLKANDVVEIEVVNPTNMWHPMHLHGHRFAVMGVNMIWWDDLPGGVGNRARNDARNNTVQFRGPIFKDTIPVPPEGGFVVIRFVTDNPGLWFFHCHVDFHLGTPSFPC